jgi:hypothetical protein
VPQIFISCLAIFASLRPQFTYWRIVNGLNMAGRKRHYFGNSDKPIFVDKIESKSNFLKNQLEVPKGYLRVSDATSRFQRGMWNQSIYPIPVKSAKSATTRRTSIEFGPWRTQAAKVLRGAITKGKLTLYVAAGNEKLSNKPAENSSVLNQLEIQPVPIDLIKRVITLRGNLPDHSFRLSGRASNSYYELRKLLRVGLLVVRKDDFERLYCSELAKSKWPSQQSSSKPKIGRPAKYSSELKSDILQFASESENGKITISALHRWLVKNRRRNVPSQDTLARLVDQIHSETGEPGLSRPKRRRRGSMRR